MQRVPRSQQLKSVHKTWKSVSQNWKICKSPATGPKYSIFPHDFETVDVGGDEMLILQQVLRAIVYVSKRNLTLHHFIMSIALPLGKIQTPIFSRDASSRRASEAHVTVNRPSNTKSRSLPHKSLEEANLRVVQYEIAEREACRLIATMCQEGSKILNITGTEYEIDDILSGVLVLGNIYKRIGNEKYNLEATIDGMRKDYSTLETDKNYMVSYYFRN